MTKSIDIFGSQLLFSNTMKLLGFVGESVDSRYGYIFRCKPNYKLAKHALNKYLKRYDFERKIFDYGNSNMTVEYKRENHFDYIVVDIDDEIMTITYYIK